MATQKDKNREISDLFIKTGRLQFCVLALILSGFIVFGRQFIQLWAGDGYSATYTIALIFFSILTCPLIQNVGLTILLARGQVKFRSLTYLGIAIASLAAQIVVTPHYGAIGCAMVIATALFIGQWVIMNIYYRQRQGIAIGQFWLQITRMAITPTLITFAACLLLRFINISSWWDVGAAILVFLSVYLPCFYFFSMNQYERDNILIPLKAIAARIR